MTATTGDRALTVQEAYDALDAFGRRAGRVPLLLLLHASVPQSFRADLLNLLKTNFLATEAGPDMTIDVDVLLSPLVQPAAAGYYRLDPEVRRHGLALLDAEYRHQPERRSVEVARLILAYTNAVERDAGQALDALLSEYLAVQRWVALAFIDPEGAAEAFARAIRQGVDAAGGTARLRLGSITAAVSIPLAGHRELLAYARGIDAIASGDAATGERLLDWVGEEELRIGDVTLPTARRVRKVMTEKSTRQAAESAEPPRDVIYISHALDDRDAAESVARALVGAGLDVRINRERLIAGDRVIQEGIRDAIGRSTLFLALLSRHTLRRTADVFRFEWRCAFDRAARSSSGHQFVLPVTLERISPETPGVPNEMREIPWAASVAGGVTGEFMQSVRAVLARNRRGSSPPPRTFGVPAAPAPIIGREHELDEMKRCLTTRPPFKSGGDGLMYKIRLNSYSRRASRANVVSLIGPDGIGKWTLASHVAHKMTSHFSDGIIWVGGDGSGAPRAALRAYAEALGIAHLFGPNDVIDSDRFAKAFASRRVLFVTPEIDADFARAAFNAGRSCAILHLGGELQHGLAWSFTLPALGETAARQLLTARAGRTVERAEIAAFAEGSPLLIRLLGGAVRATSESDVLTHVIRFTPPAASSGIDPKVRWLVDFLLHTPAREDMRILSGALENGTQVAADRLLDIRPTWLEDLGLLNIHADLVRVPPQVAAAVRDLLAAPPARRPR